MECLRVNNLTKIYRKTFDGIEGIEGVSINLQQGEVLALIGPNGAGKTTLIKIITTQLRPDSGEVFIYNYPLLGIIKEPRFFELRRQIGYAPEMPFFYSKLTGWEFARFLASIYESKLDEGGNLSFVNIANILNLTQNLGKMISTYSQGMIRKLMISFAIAFGKKLIILDEPSNGLDPDSYLMLKELIKECKSQGRTVFLSTHHLSLAEDTADKIAMLYKGHLKAFVPNNKNIEEFYKSVINKGGAV